MTIWTVSDQIYYAYANLAMADYAVSKGLIKYDRICFMIRSRLYKGLQKGDMKIHSLLDDEKLKLQNGTRCVYCGADTEISIDHMIPRIKGAQIFQTILFAHAKRATVQKERRTSWNGITTSSPSLRSCFYVAISS